MIVELIKDNGNRKFVEAYEINETDNDVIVYQKNPEKVNQRKKFTKDEFQYIKVKKSGGQPNWLKRKGGQ